MGLPGKLKLSESPSLPNPHNPLPHNQDEALLNPLVIVLVNISLVYRALVFVISGSKMMMCIVRIEKW